MMAYNKSFHLIGQGTPNVRFFSKVQEEKLAEMLCSSDDGNLIYSRHMYFTNFAASGCNISYFNMVCKIMLIWTFLSNISSRWETLSTGLCLVTPGTERFLKSEKTEIPLSEHSKDFK